MNTLFPLEPSFPPGFSYAPDFITEDEEIRLSEGISKMELQAFTFQGFKANRRVASFGYDYSFENGKIARGKEIPLMFKSLIENVAAYLAIQADELAELLVTEYPPASVINWHRDAPPFDIIAGISLLEDCIFRLRPYDKVKQSRSSIIPISVKRRSLYIIRGEARTEWQHSIAPVKQTRYSITLRTLISPKYA
jgi:alkylated DNA repair dioxygenase AlkB